MNYCSKLVLKAPIIINVRETLSKLKTAKLSKLKYYLHSYFFFEYTKKFTCTIIHVSLTAYHVLHLLQRRITAYMFDYLSLFITQH